jgi:hypothetical protein
VSLRLQLLQVARLAPRLLGESTDLVREFYRRQFDSRGAASDRGGKPDLYYTIFAMAGALALDVPMPLDRTRAWLLSFQDGARLDLVHLGALARCWAEIGRAGIPDGLDRRILENIERFRKPDGGYDVDPKLPHGTAYGAFIALGAWQDLGHTPPQLLDLVRCFKHLESSDGGWSNQPGMSVGALNATAGAVTLIRHLGFPVNQSVADWLLAQAGPQGGFKATPLAPIPDLLSTATALHALAAMDCRISSELHERCLDFVDSLWDAGGGFHGNWTDDVLDPEYTFYGLLALGHLSLA